MFKTESKKHLTEILQAMKVQNNRTKKGIKKSKDVEVKQYLEDREATQSEIINQVLKEIGK